MTKEEIIETAREAGGYYSKKYPDEWRLDDEDLVRFAKLIAEKSKQEQDEPKCKTHPDAPHGFVRNASHSEDRYVCECESWEPPEQDEPSATLIEHYAFTDGIVRFDGVENMEQLPVGTKLYTKPQYRKPLTDYEFLELLLRKGNSELLHYTTFVGGSIQMQGKIGLLKSAKVIKEFIEECYGIKE